MTRLTPYESGRASITDVERRSGQWLHDMHRNALRTIRENPARRAFYEGRRDVIRETLNARATGAAREPIALT